MRDSQLGESRHPESNLAGYVENLQISGAHQAILSTSVSDLNRIIRAIPAVPGGNARPHAHTSSPRHGRHTAEDIAPLWCRVLAQSQIGQELSDALSWFTFKFRNERAASPDAQAGPLTFNRNSIQQIILSQYIIVIYKDQQVRGRFSPSSPPSHGQ